MQTHSAAIAAGSTPITPWTTLGVSCGLVRGHPYAVRWDLDTSARGMAGYTSTTRRFASADEAIAAVAAGMGRAWCATAFDDQNRQIALRRNPRHWRNRGGQRRK